MQLRREIFQKKQLGGNKKVGKRKYKSHIKCVRVDTHTHTHTHIYIYIYIYIYIQGIHKRMARFQK
jgi:hypothetical protein